MSTLRSVLTGGIQSTYAVQQPDFSQGRRGRQVQTHDEAARGGKQVQQRASGKSLRARMSGGKSSQMGRHEHPREIKAENPWRSSAKQGAQRHARFLACAADAEYRDCSCRGAEREAQSLLCKCTLTYLPRERRVAQGNRTPRLSQNRT